jgi:hypothetical protein
MTLAFFVPVLQPAAAITSTSDLASQDAASALQARMLFMVTPQTLRRGGVDDVSALHVLHEGGRGGEEVSCLTDMTGRHKVL